jgi:hypothetical protein
MPRRKVVKDLTSYLLVECPSCEAAPYSACVSVKGPNRSKPLDNRVHNSRIEKAVQIGYAEREARNGKVNSGRSSTLGNQDIGNA